ncbi:hypothetical protein Ping_0964 [Psychromonas ingrahamii 37]|uniref:Uncharacterized protein n=2 Tax=Psychromonas ingrahamii TaxID=357794 RepID=A1STJ0_PSYIN|nr:hypothetical protein Ping_0964 [Psychromonas ingrahamii 37]
MPIPGKRLVISSLVETLYFQIKLRLMKMKKVMISLLAIVLTFAFSSVEAKSDHEKSLPPGLQKKVARGGSLPPGWQKKLAVGEKLERQVYDSADIVFPVDDQGIITIKVEGRVIRLIKESLDIVEILQ